jgi:4-oxalocrotonate tautomerase
MRRARLRTSETKDTWVTIEEVDSGDWGIGGKALTTSDVHALAAGKAA